MSLDKLRIPGIVLKELFPNQLIQPEGGAVIAEPAANHEVMVVLNRLAPDTPGILSRILQACKWNPDRTTIVNRETRSETWAQLKQHGLPRICLLLGADGASIDLPVIFPPFRVQAFDGVKFVAAPELAEIEADRLLKSKLWLCLKELFNLP